MDSVKYPFNTITRNIDPKWLNINFPIRNQMVLFKINPIPPAPVEKNC